MERHGWKAVKLARGERRGDKRTGGETAWRGVDVMSRQRIISWCLCGRAEGVWWRRLACYLRRRTPIFYGIENARHMAVTAL
jgi:hypothetical protein